MVVDFADADRGTGAGDPAGAAGVDFFLVREGCGGLGVEFAVSGGGGGCGGGGVGDDVPALVFVVFVGEGELVVVFVVVVVVGVVVGVVSVWDGYRVDAEFGVGAAFAR